MMTNRSNPASPRSRRRGTGPRGRTRKPAGPQGASLEGFLAGAGFVILARNRQDPGPAGEFEAWAYQGPLDFEKAVPVVFGAGRDVAEALAALDSHLQHLPRRT